MREGCVKLCTRIQQFKRRSQSKTCNFVKFGAVFAALFLLTRCNKMIERKEGKKYRKIGR